MSLRTAAPAPRRKRKAEGVVGSAEAKTAKSLKAGTRAQNWYADRGMAQN